MNVSELREYLSRPGIDPNMKVLVDIKPWDEPLNLTPMVSATSYAAHGDDAGFIVLTPATKGATNLNDGDMLAALKAAYRMIEEALPKFNWGASTLDANAIHLLNDAPVKVAKAIAKAEGRS